MKQVVVPLVCSALAFLGGYLLQGDSEPLAVSHITSISSAPLADQNARPPTSISSSLIRDFGDGLKGKARFYFQVETMDFDALRALASKLLELPPSDRAGWVMRNIVFARLAELDASSALKFIGGLEQSSYGRHALGSAIAKMATTNTAEAVSVIRALSDTTEIAFALASLNDAEIESYVPIADYLHENPDLIGKVTNSFFETWCRKDRQHAISFVNSLPNQYMYEGIHGIASILAEDDPTAAEKWMLTVPVDRRDYVAGILAERLASTDPKEALAFLDRLPPGFSRVESLVDVARGWHLADHKAALEWIQELPRGDLLAVLRDAQHSMLEIDPDSFSKLVGLLPEGGVSDNYVASIANQWGRSDPAAAANWVKELPESNVKANALRQIAGVWSKTNPAKAAALLGNRLSERDTEVLKLIAWNWAGRDPNAAVAWSNQLELDNSERGALVESLTSAWARQDPLTASDYVLGITDDRERNFATSGLVLQWAKSDSAAAEHWINESLPESARPRAYSALIGALVDNDVAAAAEMFNTHVTGGISVGDSASRIASKWVQTEPEAAASWAASLTEENGRSAATYRVALQWAGIEPQAASEWVLGLESGFARDQAVTGLTRSIETNDPLAALEWAASMSDPQRQRNVYIGIVHRWANRAPNEARAGVLSSNLSEEAKDTLLNRIP